MTRPFARLSIFGVLLLSALATAVFAHAIVQPSQPEATSVAVPGDRWMEIDLYWFEQDHAAESVNRFWERFATLYQDIDGDKGIILNVGWTVNYIMAFTGDLHQQLVLPIGTGQQPWVDMNSALPGSTADREREWKERFSHPHIVPRQGYGPWTYGDIQQLAALLRAGAERRGIHGFRVATLCYAWTNAYGEIAPFARRHPEAWTQWGKHSTNDFTLDLSGNFDPAKTLHADTGTFAGIPGGIPEGMPVHQAFARQWGALSKSVGLDGLMLRDSFGFPTPYVRSGPLGPVMPDPETIHCMTEGVSSLLRELKQANPAALTMMYSNGASAIADWRSNGLDLERIAREGFLDIFVDQTWAGAWNEVGVRHDLFWNTPLLGWTYQFAYLLEHSAILAGTHVRHYPLVETFDAWESWDIIHTVPQRLRWGIWQFSHAGVKTPVGLEMPQGTYISWANQGKRLLGEADVAFLRETIDTAVRDAAQTTEIYGPTVVYSRDAMQFEAEHATANHDIKEWIDEQVGSVIKWPVPVLSITRAEWVSQVHSDLFLFGAPVHLPPAQLHTLETLAHAGQPMAFLGSEADGIDPALLALAGLTRTGHASETAIQTSGHPADASPQPGSPLPPIFPLFQRVSPASAAPRTVVYSVKGAPALVLNQAKPLNISVWDPPELQGRCCKPLREIMGGSPAPYALAAATFTKQLAVTRALRAASIDVEQTSTVAAWKTRDGRVHLLAGNLEEGLRDDADHTRHLTFVLPQRWNTSVWRSLWSSDRLVTQSERLPLNLGPEGSILLESTPQTH